MRFMNLKELETELPNKNGLDIIKIKLDDIKFSIFSNLKCINCGMYKRNKHCIPLNFKSGKKVLEKYKNIYLLIYKRDLNERVEEFRKKLKVEYFMYKYACGTEVMSSKKFLNDYLPKLNLFMKSKEKDFILYGYGGGCTGCRTCSIFSKEKCKKPNSYFRAPESTGIDVYKTLENINYEFQIIPKEFVISVALLATNLDLEKYYM